MFLRHLSLTAHVLSDLKLSAVGFSCICWQGTAAHVSFTQSPKDQTTRTIFEKLNNYMYLITAAASSWYITIAGLDC